MKGRKIIMIRSNQNKLTKAQKGDICAIVIGDDHYNVLGVVRSLGEKSIPVILFMYEENVPYIVSRSRYVSQIRIINRDPFDTINKSNEISTFYKNVFIYPLSDYSAMICDKYCDSFNHNIFVPNAKGMLSKYENKYYLSSIANSNGIMCPKHIVADLDNDNSFAKWHLFPAIIKPLLSIEGHKSDIQIANNFQDLSSIAFLFKDKGYKRILIEEYIDGTDSNMIEILGLTDGKGNVFLSHIIRKIREYPIKNGSTAFAEINSSLPNLNLSAIEAFISKLDFNGLFDLEMKRKIDQYYFIELNFRNGAPGHSITKHGFNIPYEWISLMSNKEVHNMESERSQLIMCETHDAINALKGCVNIFVWLKQFFKSDKLIWDRHDLKISILLYFAFFKDLIHRLFQNPHKRIN